MLGKELEEVDEKRGREEKTRNCGEQQRMEEGEKVGDCEKK